MGKISFFKQRLEVNREQFDENVENMEAIEKDKSFIEELKNYVNDDILPEETKERLREKLDETEDEAEDEIEGTLELNRDIKEEVKKNSEELDEMFNALEKDKQKIKDINKMLANTSLDEGIIDEDLEEMGEFKDEEEKLEEEIVKKEEEYGIW